MLASIPVATELKTPYFSAGEATEATGSKGSRYSFRTGTDTYALAAAGAPWAFENLGKNWTMIFRIMRGDTVITRSTARSSNPWAAR